MIKLLEHFHLSLNMNLTILNKYFIFVNLEINLFVYDACIMGATCVSIHVYLPVWRLQVDVEHLLQRLSILLTEVRS